MFTNLTHEHLDLHGTFEAYRAAKLRLFQGLGAGHGDGDVDANPVKTVGGRPWPKVAIVNRDDAAAPWFEAAAHEAGAARRDVRRRRVGRRAGDRRRGGRAPPPGGVRRAVGLRRRWSCGSRAGSTSTTRSRSSPSARGSAWIPPPSATGLESVEGVPGRMERIDEGQPFAVIVDYAHSPASLGGVLDLLAPVAAAGGGGLIAVFGSGGERDTAKRGAMGRIAAERCRLVVATDEDPRGEDRDAIIDEIVRGAEAGGARRGVDVLAIADRREAIAAAFERARPGDVVLLAGKGHEATILYADGPIDWDEAGRGAPRARLRPATGAR